LVALLDVVQGVADTAEAVTKSPLASTLAFLGALAGLVSGSMKILERITEARRQRNYKGIGPTDPMPLPVVDHERIAMLARITQVERDAADARAAWRNSDAEKKLAEAIPEMERMRSRIVRQAAVIEELKKMNGELRLENARLQLELNSPTIDDAVTVLDDVSERIPTIPPLRSR
jgi:hypothetical protein